MRKRRCMTEQEMREHGMECEKKIVAITIEGNPTYQEQCVWFSLQARENFQKAFPKHIPQ